MTVEPDAWDSAGEPLVSLDRASQRLGYKKRSAVEAMITEQEFELVPADRVAKVGGQGRRTTLFLRRADVEAVRAKRLASIGAVDATVATERDDLKARISALETELRRSPAGPSSTVHAHLADRLVELERRNAELIDRVGRLRGAFEAGLAAQNAQLEQIRHLMLPSGVWEDPLVG